MPKMISFYQDRLGTNIGKALKKSDAFPYSYCGKGIQLLAVEVRKRVFILCLHFSGRKTDDLPRQARDNHIRSIIGASAALNRSIVGAS